MKYRLDGTCVYCLRATPVSRNTQRPEGIVCCSCRSEKRDTERLRALQRERLAELEAERHRLLAALSYQPLLN